MWVEFIQCVEERIEEQQSPYGTALLVLFMLLFLSGFQVASFLINGKPWMRRPKLNGK